MRLKLVAAPVLLALAFAACNKKQKDQTIGEGSTPRWRRLGRAKRVSAGDREPGYDPNPASKGGGRPDRAGHRLWLSPLRQSGSPAGHGNHTPDV